MDKKESVFEAFIRQHSIKPGSFEQSELHERMYGGGTDPGEIERKQDLVAQQLASKGRFQPVIISNHIDIPRTTTEEDLCDKTVPHPLMEKYDHSLEMDRWGLCGGANPDDGIEM